MSVLLSGAGSLGVAMLVAVVAGAYKRRGEPLVQSLFMEYFTRSSKPLHDKLEELEEQVKGQSEAISELGQDISTVRSGFRTQTGAIGELQGEVSALCTGFGEQSEAIGGIRTGVVALDENVGEQSEAIGGIRTGVVALDKRVGRQSETIESVQQIVRGVKAQGAATDGKVDVLGAKVDDLDTKVGDLISLELGVGDAHQPFRAKYGKPRGEVSPEDG